MAAASRHNRLYPARGPAGQGIELQQLQLHLSNECVQFLLDNFKVALWSSTKGETLVNIYRKEGFTVPDAPPRGSDNLGLIDVWPDYLHATLGIHVTVPAQALPLGSADRSRFETQFNGLFATLPSLVLEFCSLPVRVTLGQKHDRAPRLAYIIKAAQSQRNETAWSLWKAAAIAIGVPISTNMQVEDLHITLKKYVESQFTLPDYSVGDHPFTMNFDTIVAAGPGEERPAPFRVKLVAMPQIQQAEAATEATAGPDPDDFAAVSKSLSVLSIHDGVAAHDGVADTGSAAVTTVTSISTQPHVTPFTIEFFKDRNDARKKKAVDARGTQHPAAYDPVRRPDENPNARSPARARRAGRPHLGAADTAARSDVRAHDGRRACPPPAAPASADSDGWEVAGGSKGRR
jgi:hypothetical protein